jgi:hypothetical protein
MNGTINWFQGNLLTLNCIKTHFLQFFTKKQIDMKIQIVTSNSVITNINSTKFLGLTVDSILTWTETHCRLNIHTKYGLLHHQGNQNFYDFKCVEDGLFFLLHLVMSYGIFWGNSHLSNNIFKI